MHLLSIFYKRNHFCRHKQKALIVEKLVTHTKISLIHEYIDVLYNCIARYYMPDVSIKACLEKVWPHG